MASNSTTDYPPEEFTKETDEDGATHGTDDEGGDDESIGDHVEGDPANEEEGDD